MAWHVTETAAHPRIRHPRTRVAITVAALGVLTFAALGWYLQVGRAEPGRAGQGGLAETAELTETGVVDGDGPVTVQVWLGLGCTDCQELMVELDALLGQLVTERRVSRIYHPVGIGEDSLRVAASVACAAELGAHPPYVSALLSRPPAADGSPPSDDELVFLAGTTGLIDPTFAQCVRAQRQLGWAREIATRAGAAPVTDLPVVRVERTVVDLATATADATADATVDAAGAAGATAAVAAAVAAVEAG